jgi:glycosyltransferase involved in cell wall biosynthesis
MQWALQNKLNISNIEFLGKLTNAQAQEYIKHSKVFVHPSLEESFGMVLVEAMRWGTPTIAGENSGAVPWVVNNTGILCNIRKPEVIRHHMLELCSNTDTWAKFSRNGPIRLQNFLASQTKEKLKSLYDTVARL